MSTQLVSTTKDQALTPEVKAENERVALIKRTICRGATDDELQLFLHVCKRTGLDPFARQIYAVKRPNRKTGKDDMVVQTSIDGYRLTAEKSGCYAGSDDAVFDDEKEPNKATVTVYKMVQGQRCAFTASARWSEYCPPSGQDFMWKKMPCVMLSKVAESLALRKAFPADLSGIYTDAEMDQAGSNRIAPEQPGEDDGVQEQGVQIPYGPLAKQYVHQADPVALREYILSEEKKWKDRGLTEPPNWARAMIAAAEPVIAKYENTPPKNQDLLQTKLITKLTNSPLSPNGVFDNNFDRRERREPGDG